MPNSGRPAVPLWADLSLVALISAGIFIYAHFPALTNPYVINDDVRQQIYWMQQWLDPGLFQGDLLSDYARHYVPWGVKGLYWLASFGAAPLNFSKVLPGLLFVFLAGCLYKIGEVLQGRWLAWTAVAVFWLMPFFLDTLSGGLPRAFAAPLLALFWLCWLKRRPWGMGAALLLQALFIPYIFILAATAAMLAWAIGLWGKGEMPPFPSRPAHLILIAAAAGLVVLMHHQFNAAGFGPLVSAGDMGNRPEFSSTGRYPILPVPSILWELASPWEFIPPFREMGIVPGALICALLLGLGAYGVRRLDWQELRARLQPAIYLGLSSLLLYFLARLFLLKLFLPDRYLTYTLNLFYCLALGLSLGAALQIRRWPRALALLALILAVTLSGLRLKGVGLFDYSAYRPLYAALAQTPKEVLVAGHPNLMDNVLAFAHRRVFASFELAHPWSKGYWRQLRPRLEEVFAAYYAADPEVVLAFCRKYQISFLVVDDRHFTPAFLSGGRFFVPFDDLSGKTAATVMAELVSCPFFAPFDQQIRRLIQDRRQFALLSPGVFQPLILDEHLRLLDMRPWLK